MDKISNEVMHDLFTNPKKYNAPTYEEFCANKEAWKETLSKAWGRIEQSSVLFKNSIGKQYYKFKGYRFETLEKVESVIWDHGVNPLHCEIKPQVIPNIGGKCDVCVEFVEPRKSIESLLKL